MKKADCKKCMATDLAEDKKTEHMAKGMGKKHGKMMKTRNKGKGTKTTDAY